MNARKKALTALSIAFLTLATVMCWALLELIAVISVDDAMYSGWTQHGFKYFIDKNVWHYLNFNGRFFVHFILQIVLIFEEHLYAVIFPFFISVSAFIVASIAKKEWSIYQRLFVSAISLIAYLCLSARYVTTTAMWISGGFNYVFPLIAIFSFYYVFLKNRQKTKALAYLIPFALLCGATTEQYGMYTVGIITLTYFFDALKNKRVDKRGFIYLGAAICGLLTVILAPPTLNRLNTKTELSLIDGITYNWKFLGGEESTVLLPALFMLITALIAAYNLYSKKYRYNKLLVLGLPLSVAAYLFYRCTMHTGAMIITYAYVILVIVTMLKSNETRELGKILLCGFGTYVMMGITTIATCWTAIPCILSFIIVIAIMLVELLSEIKIRVFSIIIIGTLFISGLILYNSSYIKYKAESIFCNELYEQMQSANESGKIEYNWDNTIPTRLVTHRNMTLVDFYPLAYYQEKFDIPDNVKYIITSKMYNAKNLSCNGLYSQAPAVKLGNEIYVPAQTPYLDACLKQEVSVAMLYNDNQAFIGVRIGDDTIRCAQNNTLKIGHLIYIKLDVILEQYKYKCSFDKEENTYILTK